MTDVISDRTVATSAVRRIAARTVRVRSAAAAVVLLGVGLLTAACSPASHYVTAVFVDGQGHITALFHPCDGGGTERVRLVDTTPEPQQSIRPMATASSSATPAPADPHGLEWTVEAGSSGSELTEVRLLSLPSGWTLETDEDELLREFRGDRTYRVTSDDSRDDGISFSLAQLASMQPNWVWTELKGGGGESSWERQQFFSSAEESCED